MYLLIFLLYINKCDVNKHAYNVLEAMDINTTTTTTTN
jgi:hypothetical protein